MEFFDSNDFGDLEQIYDFLMIKMSDVENIDLSLFPNQKNFKDILLNTKKINIEEDSGFYFLREQKKHSNKDIIKSLKDYYNCRLVMEIGVSFLSNLSLLEKIDDLKSKLKPYNATNINEYRYRFELKDKEMAIDVNIQNHKFEIISYFLSNESFLDLADYAIRQPLENKKLIEIILLFPQISKIMNVFERFKKEIKEIFGNKVSFEIIEIKIIPER